jgi:hypothetical protein
MTVIDPPAINSTDISSPGEGTAGPRVEPSIMPPPVLALEDEPDYWRNRLLETLFFDADGLRRMALGVPPRKRHIRVVRVLRNGASIAGPRRFSQTRRAPDDNGELA